MSGLVLPPGANNGIHIFKPPWEQPTPDGTSMVLSTLPKELVDHLVDRIASKILAGLEAGLDAQAAAIDRVFEEDGA